MSVKKKVALDPSIRPPMMQVLPELHRREVAKAADEQRALIASAKGLRMSDRVPKVAPLVERAADGSLTSNRLPDRSFGSLFELIAELD